MNKKKNYDESSIKVLDGTTAIRKHPGMYIGDIESPDGPIQLLFEVIDNSVDEHISGTCNAIEIILHKTDAITVKDNGRGIPTGNIVVNGVLTNKTVLETIFTEIHSGGKFDSESYEFSGGLHGVGLSAVAALSEYLEATSFREKKSHTIKFKYGKKDGDIIINSCQDHISGAVIHFLPDKSIFKKISINAETVISKLRYISALNSNLKITFIDERTDTKLNFAFSGGINEFLNEEMKEESGQLVLNDNISINEKTSDVMFDTCFNWVKGSEKENIKAFTNGIIQIDGGAHVNGIKQGLVKVISKFIYKLHLIKKEDNLEIIWNDIKKGFFCIINARIKHPRFASQTKDKLISSDVKNIIEQSIIDNFTKIIENNMGAFKQILMDISLNACLRNRDKNLKETTKNQSKLFSAMMFDGNLTECKEQDAEKCEIFIVEGESAGGSAKQGRNRLFQSILTLRGKILNIEKCSFDKSMNSKIIRSIVCAIGGEFSLSEVIIKNLRYNKIIIMTDADVDGSHIRALLLALFYRFIPSVITNNHLYIAMPPLYGISSGKNTFEYFDNEKSMYKYMLKTKLNLILDLFPFLNKINSDVILDQLTAILQINHLSTTLIKTSTLDEKLIDLLTIHSDINDNFIETVHHYLPSKYNITQDFNIIKLQSTSNLEEFIIDKYNIDKKILNLLNVINSNDLHNLSKLTYENTNHGLLTLGTLIYNKIKQSFYIQRYKGLGEMNPEQLWNTSMDPINRRLKLISLQDAIEADSICNQLLGSDPDLRKIFIENNAWFAQADF